MLEEQYPDATELAQHRNVIQRYLASGCRFIDRESDVLRFKIIEKKPTTKDVSVIIGTDQTDQQGFLPPPEIRDIVTRTLEGKPVPKPIKHYTQYLKKKRTIPSTYEEERREEVIPKAQLILFLHADGTTLFSSEKRGAVVAQASEALSLFHQAKQEHLLGKDIRVISSRIFVKIHTVNGTIVVPLVLTGDLTEAKKTVDFYFHNPQEEDVIGKTGENEIPPEPTVLSQFYREANNLVVSHPFHCTSKSILSHAFDDALSDGSLAKLVNQTGYFIAPNLLTTDQQYNYYVPATVVLDISSERTRVATIAGKKFCLRKNDRHPTFDSSFDVQR